MQIVDDRAPAQIEEIFCACLDSVRAVLAIDRHVQAYAQRRPVRAVESVLPGSADVLVTL